MALSQTDLKNALKKVLDTAQSTPAAAATAMANAYHDYAKAGRVGAEGVPTLPDAKRDALATTLGAAIADPHLGLPGKLAAAWASGVAAYWTGVAVVGVTQSGSITDVTSASSLSGPLATVFGNLANSTETCAAGMAAALHAATAAPSGIKATVAPPPNTILPLT